MIIEVLKVDPSINDLVFRLSTFADLVDVPPHLVRFAWHYHCYIATLSSL